MSQDSLAPMLTCIAGLTAEMKATRQLLRVLIATHPDPELLKRAWANLPARLFDGESESGGFPHPASAPAYAAALGRYSQWIEGHTPSAPPATPPGGQGSP